MTIKQLIFEADLDEEAKTVSDMKSLGLALHVVTPGYGYKFVLYSPEKMVSSYKKYVETGNKNVMKDAVFGTITANHEPSLGAVEIDTVAARNGFGPFMYDLLSTFGGWICRDTIGITNAAKRIWKYIYTNRKDYEKEHLPRDRWINRNPNNFLNYKYRLTVPVDYQELKHVDEQFIEEFQKIMEYEDDATKLIRWAGSQFFDSVYN